VVHRYYDAWRTGTADAITEHLHEDLVGHTGASTIRRADVLAWRAALASRFSDLHVESGEELAQDDRVAVVWTSTGRTSSGDAMRWRGVSTYRIAADVIVELWEVRSPEVRLPGQ
jgi:ketosteroid isomerase-like protein